MEKETLSQKFMCFWFGIESMSIYRNFRVPRFSAVGIYFFWSWWSSSLFLATLLSILFTKPHLGICELLDPLVYSLRQKSCLMHYFDPFIQCHCSVLFSQSSLKSPRLRAPTPTVPRSTNRSRVMFVKREVNSGMQSEVRVDLVKRSRYSGWARGISFERTRVLSFRKPVAIAYIGSVLTKASWFCQSDIHKQ